MKTNAVNSKDIMLKNGLYYGLTLIAVSVVVYAMGLTFSGDTAVGLSVTILSFLVMILFVILGISQYKSANSGYITLSQALKIGVGLVLVGALVSGVYNLIFVTLIEPDFTEKMLSLQREKMAEMGNLTSEQIDQSVDVMRKFMSPLSSFLISIGGTLFFGFIISLIAGAVMQKKEQSF